MAAFGISSPAVPPPAYVPPPQASFGAAAAASLMPPPAPRAPPVASQQLPPPSTPPPSLVPAGRQGGLGAGGGGPGGGGGAGRGGGGSGLAGRGVGGGVGKLSFLGRPVSAALVDKGLAVMPVDSTSSRHCCHCNVQGTGFAQPHFCWECPLKYLARFGSCPGFNRDGSRAAAAWSGEDITVATKSAWNDFIRTTGLESAVSAPAEGGGFGPRSTSPDSPSRRGGQ
jgi:hypothetical protein